MNGTEIIIASATEGGGIIMISVVLVLIGLFLSVRWFTQRRRG